MSYDKLAVATVEGMQDRFIIVDFDSQMPRLDFMRWSDALNEKETRTELRGRGYYDSEIETLIKSAREDPR